MFAAISYLASTFQTVFKNRKMKPSFHINFFFIEKWTIFIIFLFVVEVDKATKKRILLISFRAIRQAFNILSPISEKLFARNSLVDQGDPWGGGSGFTLTCALTLTMLYLLLDLINS